MPFPKLYIDLTSKVSPKCWPSYHLHSLNGLSKNRIPRPSIAPLEELLHLSEVGAGGKAPCDRVDDIAHGPTAAKKGEEVSPVFAQMLPGKSGTLAGDGRSFLDWTVFFKKVTTLKRDVTLCCYKFFGDRCDEGIPTGLAATASMIVGTSWFFTSPWFRTGWA